MRRRTPHGAWLPLLTASVLFALPAGGGPSAQEQPLPDGYVRSPAVEPGQAPGMEVHERAAPMRVLEIAFAEGDEILSGLTDLVQRHGITSAQITGLGGLAEAMLAFGDPSIGAFVFKQIPIEEKSELVSLVGNVSLRDGEPYVHLHAVLALEDGTTRGGHVLALDVAPVAEVTIVVTAAED